jgi:hypothetical protein
MLAVVPGEVLARHGFVSYLICRIGAKERE